MIKAVETLYALGAFNDSRQLTAIGRRMAELPVDPHMSKVIISSVELECVKEVVTIFAMLGAGGSVFYRPKGREV